MSSQVRHLLPARRPRIALPQPTSRRATPAGTDAELALHPTLLLREVLARAGATEGRASAGLESYPARGTLLRDSLLSPGDLIMVQPGQSVGDGELALVQLEGQTSPLLRRLHHADDCLRLVPEDQRCPVELRPVERVRVLGRVLSIMRQARPASQLPMAI